MTDRGRASHNLTLAGNAPSLTDVGTDRDPNHVAPVVVYLCSDAAANVSGRVIGASGYQISLYREPEVERTISLVTVAGRQFSPAVGALVRLAGRYPWPR